jgi:hypothetical protein
MGKIFFIDQIKKNFEYLFEDYVFEIKEVFFDKDAYGNSLILLESEHLRFKMINERGQIYIDVGSCLEDVWFDLNVIINYISRSKEGLWEYDYFEDSTFLKEKISKQLKNLAETIKSHYDSIQELFRKENYKDTKNKIEPFEKELFQKRWNSV